MVDDFEPYRKVLVILAWASSVVSVGIASVAFARLRATAAGILVGGGLALMTLLSIALKLVRLAFAGADGQWLMVASIAVGLVCAALTVLVAAGVLAIPSALERLGRARPAPRDAGLRS